MNTFGELFRVTTFGESHGAALGAVIDGCPSGIPLDLAVVQAALDRRRPGQSPLTSPRQELDRVEVLSGVYENKTLGTPIALLVRNVDARSQGPTRPCERKTAPGTPTSPGARASVTATLAAAAAPRRARPSAASWPQPSPKPFCTTPFPRCAWSVGSRTSETSPAPRHLPCSRAPMSTRTPRAAPDPYAPEKMAARIAAARDAGDSLGGSVDVRVTGLPIGLGEPVFGKLKATLSGALASIPAVAAVWVGPADLQQRLATPGSVFHAKPLVVGRHPRWPLERRAARAARVVQAAVDVARARTERPTRPLRAAARRADRRSDGAAHARRRETLDAGVPASRMRIPVSSTPCERAVA